MIFPLRSPFIVDFSFPWILRWIWPHVSTGTRAKEALEPLGSALPSSKGLRAKGSQSRGEPSVFLAEDGTGSLNSMATNGGWLDINTMTQIYASSYLFLIEYEFDGYYYFISNSSFLHWEYWHANYMGWPSDFPPSSSTLRQVLHRLPQWHWIWVWI